MSLPWVRLETGLAHNPKILDLVARKKHQAINLYVFSLGYSGQHGLDGYIPPEALPILHGTTIHARELVEASLWRPCGAGWEINGWVEFQRSSDENAARKARAKAAAELRWARKRGEESGAVQPLRKGSTA